MDLITPLKITFWVNKHAEHFKSEDYQESGRGRAGRCNLQNELDLIVTIFNWYKASEQFEKEALLQTSPARRKHRVLEFIKPLRGKKKQIDIQSAYLFFEKLSLLYRDLAQIQFYCAGRIGEITGLQWNNIDLKNRRMLIQQTCVFHPVKKTFLELELFQKIKRPSQYLFRMRSCRS